MVTQKVFKIFSYCTGIEAALQQGKEAQKTFGMHLFMFIMTPAMKDIHELLNNAQSIARIFISRIVQPGDTVVDATAGNGQDTLYLARCVGPKGKVFGFDVQKQAIEKTSGLVSPDYSEQVYLIHDCHTTMEARIKEPVTLVLFNLGYLPGSDRSVKTLPETTAAAAESACRLLRPGGAVLCVVYRGHHEGRGEWQALVSFGGDLDQNTFNCCVLDFPNQVNNPPGLIAFQKR